MVRESYDGIIGDAPSGAIPFHRLFDISDSLRRHVYVVGVEGMMSSRRKSRAKPEGLSQLNLNAAGIDSGGHQPLCGSSRRPRGAAGAGV